MAVKVTENRFWDIKEIKNSFEKLVKGENNWKK